MARNKRPPLAPKRQQWAQRRGGAVFRGTPLNYNVSVQSRYDAALQKMITAMERETRREIEHLFRSDTARAAGLHAEDASIASQARKLTNALMKRFQILFNGRAQSLAKIVAEGVDRSSRTTLKTSLEKVTGGLTLKTDVLTPRVRDVTKAAVAENVALIKSIPQSYFRRIQGAVMRSIVSGNGLADLVPAIEKTGQVTKKRAALIARDQTSKTTTAINRARMQDLGIKKFEWLHSGGSQEPRKYHIEMSGQIYSLDNPPVIDPNTGERGLPGQLINCRCRMVPVVDFTNGETG